MTNSFLWFPGGEKKFFVWMREMKYLQSDNSPYQKYIDNGWLVYIMKKVGKANPLLIIGVSRFRILGLSKIDKLVRLHFPICPPCNE